MKFIQATAIGFLLILWVLQIAPSPAYAGSLLLVDCQHGQQIDTGRKDADGNKIYETECGFLDAIAEVKQLINFAFIVAMPIVVIAVAYAGIQILLAQGNMGKVKAAKDMAQKVLIGFIFVLVAWLIVYTITSYLLRPEFYNVFLGDANSSEVIN